MKGREEDIKTGRTVKITPDEIWNRAYSTGFPGSPKYHLYFFFKRTLRVTFLVNRYLLKIIRPLSNLL
jgi:hypothetical protein